LIVNTLTANALIHKKITVLGGEQQRPQIHIQDLTDYLVAMLTSPVELIGGEVFNAGGENISILEIARVIQGVLGEEIDIESAPQRDDERSYHVSSEKIARVLGMYPNYTVREAVSDIVDAYRQKLFTDPLDPIYHNVQRMKMLGVR
jgi:nucleoside-diphosphate-sugar epimerase